MKRDEELLVVPEPDQPEYIVGNARLWIGDVAFEPGSAMTALDRISPGLLEFYLAGGHLIPKEAV